jgi:hypothetical protein
VTNSLLWSLRGLWIVLPVALGPSLADALDARSAAVGLVLEVLLWLGWALGLVAVLVPRTVSLTALRILTPLALATAVWSAFAEGVAGWDVIGVALAAVIVVVSLTPRVGEIFVDGSSYGPEHRLLLRPPAALLFGPVQLATAVVGGGLTAGPLLLAAHQWILGGILLVVGPFVAAVGARSLHGLSRRWLVLVPGGIVVHDPLTLGDPVLLPKEALVSVAPAAADTDATDLTQRASGLAVEIRISEPGQFVLLRPRQNEGEIVTTSAILVTPSRPAELITEVDDRF